MHDLRTFRTHLTSIQASLARRGFNLDVSFFESLEHNRKEVQEDTQSLQEKRNQLARQVGIAKQKGEDASALLEASSALQDRLKDLEQRLAETQTALENFLLSIPNLPQEEVPSGKDERDNVEIKKVGTIPSFDFTIQDHVSLGEALGLMSFEEASKLSGARFVVLHGALARLQRALIQWMLDVHTQQHGYEECYVPYLVHASALLGTGQLPKFEGDFFKAGTEHFLIPTAEVPVTNLLRDMIVDEHTLPRRLVAHTPCFRSEAGSYGRDTRGMLRQHQFEKVELVQIAHPEGAKSLLEELTRHAERLLEDLGLPYRRMLLCTGDMGFASSITYDLEVWIPSQNTYREISSCSYFGDFQARRMHARFRSLSEKKNEYVHTLNGSGLAVGRTLLALMECCQRSDGSIKIPKVLRPYMGGLEVIQAKDKT